MKYQTFLACLMLASTAAAAGNDQQNKGNNKNANKNGGGQGGNAASQAQAAQASQSAAAAAAAAKNGGNANGGNAAQQAAAQQAAAQQGQNGQGNAAAAAGGTTLDPTVIQKASQADGLQDASAKAGQAASDTDAANFINICKGQTLTDGTQFAGGSCNGIPMGQLPSQDKMVSAMITSPAPMEDLPANQDITMVANYKNLQLGTFTNPDVTYYAAPQKLNGQGVIIGHTHFTVQNMNGNANPQQALDPVQFDFFKGVDGAADGAGNVAVTITGGLPAGTYRVCLMSSAANHQAVTMPVAQRGAQDDCQKFTVGGGGGNGANAAGGNAQQQQAAAAAAAAKGQGNAGQGNAAQQQQAAAAAAKGQGNAGQGNAAQQQQAAAAAAKGQGGQGAQAAQGQQAAAGQQGQGQGQQGQGAAAQQQQQQGKGQQGQQGQQQAKGGNQGKNGGQRRRR